jgi:hypothetical protein
MKAFSRNQHLSLAVQLYRLKELGLANTHGRFAGHHRIEFEYDAVASPIGRTYRLRLTLGSSGPPRVRVLTPDLFALSRAARPPHIHQPFEHPATLCLYLPGTGEWTRAKPLAETIVPWSVEWLFYFECWLATDEWKGGGHTVSDSDKVIVEEHVNG